MTNKILTMIFLITVYVFCEQLVFRTFKEDFNKPVIQPIESEAKGDCLPEDFNKPVIQPIERKAKDDCVTIDFHYLIVGDAQYTPISRQLHVFLDEKAFSEKNLKTLFNYLAQEYYPGKKRLTISVSTNWNQFYLPPACGSRGIGAGDASNDADEPETFEYHKAEYFRDEKEEYFTYNPKLKTEKVKKIILKEKNSNP